MNDLQGQEVPLTNQEEMKTVRANYSEICIDFVLQFLYGFKEQSKPQGGCKRYAK